MHVKHLSIGLYVGIWLALMVLTLLSFLLSLAHLGAGDIVAALVIAFVKSALVLLFFMHLIEQRAANGIVMILASLFIVLMLSLIGADVATRRTFPRTPVPVAPTG